jgi:membrane protease YdiL (CAAX protease family)
VLIALTHPVTAAVITYKHGLSLYGAVMLGNVGYFVSNFFIIVAAIIVGSRLEGDRFSAALRVNRRVARDVCITFLVLPLYLGVEYAFSVATGIKGEPLNEIMANAPYFLGDLPSMLVTLFLNDLTNVFYQELLFRALLFTVLLRVTGPVPSAILSASVFAIVHTNYWGEPWMLLGTFLDGLAYAFLLWWRKHIWCGFVLHSGINLYPYFLPAPNYNLLWVLWKSISI